MSINYPVALERGTILRHCMFRGQLVGKRRMDLTHLALLAIVQGITEFLPISSTGHLILARAISGISYEQSVLIDTALHLGSLFAVLIYFWRDVRFAAIGPFALVSDLRARRPLSWPAKLILLLTISTVPLILFGVLLLQTGALEALRTVEVIGWTTLIYGVFLYIADRFSPNDRAMKSWTWGGAIYMGIAQALSLIPGTSRSGVTMTMARFLGFERTEAARIALLMAIPAILAVTAKQAFAVIEMGRVDLTMDAVYAALLAFVSAYAALLVIMRWLRWASFTPFVVYRILLGGFLLWTAYADV